ncbi:MULTISPECIES: SDR family oxidoreductase [unclassified Pseudovibrio]|uniref:SDR family NAD(P)-dependent oxidoreductase n=1 Tax=unclassified Pseudovibrio TaxID=2627060 RepID=UPI0007AE5CF6|nr:MULTISPECIES: SDR family oxidoreductase [unclassified Pseudovibrio]KZL02481.1 3-oxoacyl-[acyl-carrier-protein] reductase FabG [Pseudovibrio sp. W74]KZL07975.1 3-oxoacyl-[acyl-carrier-protein] reductase FabG [Pseudovibrio sp. Ad14]
MSEEFTAVITGGNKGIGAALAQEMLEAGYTVICLSRREPEFTHPKLHFHQTDLLDQAQVSAAAEAIAAEHDVTHLIHNAGLIFPNLIEDAEAEDIAGLAQLHLGSALTLLKAFLPSMKAKQFGRVLFNGSRAALGAKTRTAYSASKAGMIGMARTWALELAQHQITVNVVAPGPVKTDNFWGIIPKGSEQEQKLADGIPVGRIGTVEDITNAFMFFADPKSSFITGQTLFVCGGMSVGTALL